MHSPHSRPGTDRWDCGDTNTGHRIKHRPPHLRPALTRSAQSGSSQPTHADHARTSRTLFPGRPKFWVITGDPGRAPPPAGPASSSSAAHARDPGSESAPPPRGLVPGASRPRRPAGPATCTWSSSLMSMKAGTLMVKARLRKTLRSRTTPTGKGSPAARPYAQPLPGQPARAGLVGGPAELLPPRRRLVLVSSLTLRGLLPETPTSPGNLGGLG